MWWFWLKNVRAVCQFQAPCYNCKCNRCPAGVRNLEKSKRPLLIILNFYPPTHPTHPFTRGWIRKAKHRKPRTHAPKNIFNFSIGEKLSATNKHCSVRRSNVVPCSIIIGKTVKRCCLSALAQRCSHVGCFVYFRLASTQLSKAHAVDACANRVLAVVLTSSA